MSRLARLRREPSLQTTLVGVLLVTLISAVALTGAASLLVLRSYLIQQVDEGLGSAANSYLSDPSRIQDILLKSPRALRDAGTLPSDYVVQLNLRSASDSWIVAARNLTEGEQPSVRRSVTPKTSGRYYTTSGVTTDVDWRAITVAVPQSQVTLSVAVPLTPVEHAVGRLFVIVATAGLAFVLLATMLGHWAIRRAFVPLREMEASAAAIGAGDLARRVPAGSPSTEVGRLGAALNGMLAQIERAFRAREASEARTRRFAADASHELRTPVTAIRGFAELYRQGAVQDPDDVARVMRRIEDEATRMGSMVEDLLLLARLDERRPAKLEEVDLAVLAGDAVHDAKAMDRDRAITLAGVVPGQGPGSALVTGDNHRLRQVLGNLVANALRHTPAGTPVEVAVGVYPHESGDFALLEVRDHGPGIPAEEAEKVFERFYRVDASRQRGKGGGSGLGLSIVTAVVDQHGGRVEVVPTPGGGATFRVSLPLREPAAGGDAAGDDGAGDDGAAEDEAAAPAPSAAATGSTEVIDV